MNSIAIANYCILIRNSANGRVPSIDRAIDRLDNDHERTTGNFEPLGIK